MVLRSDWSQNTCSLARGLEAIGDPWTVLVLREVFRGNGRFDAIRLRLTVADSVLTKRLSSLVKAGLLAKQDYDNGGRIRQEYVLTPMGEDTLPILNAVMIWAEKHLPAPSNVSHSYVIHSYCGKRTDSADTCTACGDRLTAVNTSWHNRAENPEPIQLSVASSRQGDEKP
jgi:DNA-binding HxlR family transcriptional regulator